MGCEYHYISKFNTATHTVKYVTNRFNKDSPVKHRLIINKTSYNQCNTSRLINKTQKIKKVPHCSVEYYYNNNQYINVKFLLL